MSTVLTILNLLPIMSIKINLRFGGLFFAVGGCFLEIPFILIGHANKNVESNHCALCLLEELDFQLR
jgi:hypothetical protein